MGPVDSGRRIDREAMRHLLETGSYKYKKVRDLDFYILKNDSGQERILVLDNGLPMYNTTIDDVALRKSPTVKEMISIKNIIKILNDTDVIISKKEESLKVIQKECIDLLDLSYDASDIKMIADDGVSAFERNDTESISEVLSLFSELLGYVNLPRDFSIENCAIVGLATKRGAGDTAYGPIVLYDEHVNAIKFIDDQIVSKDKDKMEIFFQIAMGKKKAAQEGKQVFAYLKECAMKITD